jgi:hypothetical protein
MPRHHAADPPTGDEIAAMMRRRFTRARVMQHAAARRTDAVLIFEGMIDWMERNALRQLGERLGLGPGGRDASLKCGQRREHQLCVDEVKVPLEHKPRPPPRQTSRLSPDRA